MPGSTIGIPTNFGNWSGPGYAGGKIFRSLDPSAAGKPGFLDRDGKEFLRLLDTVAPRGFFDAAPRNHDLAYEYAMRMYGEGQPKALRNPAAQFQVQFLADVDLLVNALRYQPATLDLVAAGDRDFIGEMYRKMLITAFYYVAVRDYGFGAHIHRLWETRLKHEAPDGFAEPSISDTPVLGTLRLLFTQLPEINTAEAWGVKGLERLVTSDFLTDADREKNRGLTQQEMMLFNWHLARPDDQRQALTRPYPDAPGKAEWYYGGEWNPKGGRVDFDHQLVIPRFDEEKNAFVFKGHLGGRQVEMELLNADSNLAERDFEYRIYGLDGKLATSLRWDTSKDADTFGSRTYQFTEEGWKDGVFQVIKTETVGMPTLPPLQESTGLLARWRASLESSEWATAPDAQRALDQTAFLSLLAGGYGGPGNYTPVDLLDKLGNRYPNAASLLSEAIGADGMAMRYALLHLEPFQRSGADFGAFNTQGELDRFDAATGAGVLTDPYLTDRAVLLFQTMHAPREIERFGIWFKDAFLDYRYGDPAAGTRIQFGKGDAETISGTSVVDRLYGEGGDDTITGAGANDYVEGGAGNDSVDGGEGEDTLFGGSGNDTLAGGENDDRLDAGAGSNTVHGGAGKDKIFLGAGEQAAYGDADADEFYVYGAGTFHLADADAKAGDRIFTRKGGALPAGGDPYLETQYEEISGAFYKLTADANVWQAFNGKATITQNSPTTITTADGLSLVIDNFVDGDYGVNLEDYTGAITPSMTVAGDLAPADQDLSTPGVQIGYDAYGNLFVSPLAVPDRADRLHGAGLSDRITAGGGDDDANGKAGDDELDGGSGSDMLAGGAGNDIAQGGPGDDLLGGDAGDDRLYAGITRDLAVLLAQEAPGSGRDLLLGGTGNDLLAGDAGADALLGGEGSDVLIGGAGADTLVGDLDAGVDRRDWVLNRQVLTGADGAPTYQIALGAGFLAPAAGAGAADDLYGGWGEDWLLAGRGDDVLDGGPDADVLLGEAGSDDLFGGTGNDVLLGDNALAQLLAALHGDDYLDGGDGDDSLYGGQGSDNLLGGAGNDALVGDAGEERAGDDWLDGGDGRDTLAAGAGADQLYGGDDDDLLVGDGEGVALAGADRLDGGAGNDELQGDGGDDSLAGGEGNDLLYAGDGNDRLAGDAGADQLSGEAGDDSLSGGDGVDALAGGEGNDSLDGGAGDDTTTLAGGLDGGAGDDWLDGGAGNDALQGGEGRDRLAGGEGDDRLYGQAGDDLLTGGSGDDQLEAGGGRDSLAGGTGTDSLFDVAGGDTTYVFQSGDGPTAADGSLEGLRDSGGTDTLRLEGVDPAGITVGASEDGHWMILGYGAGDLLAIENGFTGAIERFQFDTETIGFAQLIGRSLVDPLSGSDGDGRPYALGGLGDDGLSSAAGNAVLAGGPGDDNIVATGGGNTYHYAPGDGSDHLTDTSKADGFDAPNTLVLGPGILPGSVRLGLGSLLIRVGDDPADVLHLEGFDPGNPWNQPAIDQIRFDDGSQWTYADLLALGFDITGSEWDDLLDGTAVRDRLAGGRGNDALSGGEGDDIYSYAYGDGNDRIGDSAGWDVLTVGGLGPGDVLVTQDGRDLSLNLPDGGSVILSDYWWQASWDSSIDQVLFDDGTVWDSDGLRAMAAYVTPPGQDLRGGDDTYLAVAGDGRHGSMRGRPGRRRANGPPRVRGAIGHPSPRRQSHGRDRRAGAPTGGLCLSSD